MNQVAIEEYDLALKAGQREARELTAAGKNPNPAVLDEILPEGTLDTAQDVGLLEITRLHKYISIRLTPGSEKADLTTSQTMQRLLRAKES